LRCTYRLSEGADLDPESLIWPLGFGNGTGAVDLLDREVIERVRLGGLGRRWGHAECRSLADDVGNGGGHGAADEVREERRVSSDAFEIK
jgi:hypothetical protein